MKNPIFQELAQAASKGEPVALGIISGVKGSSPQKVGAKAIFYSDGRIKGTMGGGCLEAEIQQRAIQSLRTDKASTFDLLLDHDFGWDDGLICGGKVFGVILPNAQKAGAEFWQELSERKTRLEWGVATDFSIARGNRELDPALTPNKTATQQAVDWRYKEIVSPPSALWIAGAGHIAQAVAPLAQQLDFAVTVLDDRPGLVNGQYFSGEITLKADVWES